MSTFTTETFTIPASLKEAANRLAYIFDFDTGGANTFRDPTHHHINDESELYIQINTAIKPHYIPVLQDPVQAMAALTQLAGAYGREMPVQADVDAFCNNVLVGEQPRLVRIVEEEIQ